MIEHALGFLSKRVEKFCHFLRAYVVVHNLCGDNLELIDAAPYLGNGDDFHSTQIYYSLPYILKFIYVVEIMLLREKNQPILDNGTRLYTK